MIDYPKVDLDSLRLHRIGVVVPVSNVNLEPDMQLLAPAGVTVHFARAGGYDLDAVPDSEQMRGFALASLDQIIEDLSAVRPHVIAYGCTSATLAHGPAFDRQFCDEIEQRARQQRKAEPKRCAPSRQLWPRRLRRRWVFNTARRNSAFSLAWPVRFSTPRPPW